MDPRAMVAASKKVDQHADEMSLAEFHAKRFALAQQKEAEMKRRLKWDRYVAGHLCVITLPTVGVSTRPVVLELPSGQCLRFRLK